MGNIENKTKPHSAGQLPGVRVPEWINSNTSPGEVLNWCVKHNYKTVKEAAQEFEAYFGIAKQTLYKWFKEGVPHDRKDKFLEFIGDEKVTFRIPAKLESDMFIRPERARYLGAPGRKNLHLLDLLFTCVEKQGQHTLELIANGMRNATAPHLFFRWAYRDGGVPVTYIEEFLGVLLINKVHLHVNDERLHDPERFSAFARARLCGDENYAKQFYKIPK